VGLFRAFTIACHVGDGSIPCSHSFSTWRKHSSGLSAYLALMESRVETRWPNSNPRLYHLVLTAKSFLCTAAKSSTLNRSERQTHESVDVLSDINQGMYTCIQVVMIPAKCTQVDPLWGDPWVTRIDLMAVLKA